MKNIDWKSLIYIMILVGLLTLFCFGLVSIVYDIQLKSIYLEYLDSLLIKGGYYA